MKITKLGHSCLLVEMPSPTNRTVLYDPGSMSNVAVESLQYLDDIFITHNHPDHLDMPLMRQLVAKFPEVRITTTPETVQQLAQAGITASSKPPAGVEFFESPHEDVAPLFEQPQQIGIHYLGVLTHPGDSHNFTETKAVLALPVTAPWGSTVTAVKLALQLKPMWVIPIHDWHWRSEAQDQMYARLEQVFQSAAIQFIQPKNGEPFVLDV